MCVYIYIYIYTYTYVYTYIHIQGVRLSVSTCGAPPSECSIDRLSGERSDPNPNKHSLIRSRCWKCRM